MAILFCYPLLGDSPLEWRQNNLDHPAIAAITIPGALSFYFLFELGIDLLSIDGCLRCRKVVNNLRKPREYFAARMEMAVAAALRRKGHEVEFQPLLPNMRKADIVARSNCQAVYIEVKKLLQSQARGVLNRLSFSLLLAVGEIFRVEPYSKFQTLGYEIEITPAVFDILNADAAVHATAISNIISGAVDNAKIRLLEGQPPFSFAAGECVHLRVGSGIQSSVAEPALDSREELERSLAKHFKGPGAQLHPDHPGLLVIESSSILEPSAARAQIEPLLCAAGDDASHVAAAIFIPVYTSPPVRYGLFRPFAVLNPRTRFPAHDLRAFVALAETHGF